MKFWKKKLALFLFAWLLAFPSAVPVYADETAETAETQENDSEQLTANQATALIQAIATHLSAYGRYETITERSLYKAGLERLISENPELYNSVLKGMLESLDEHSEYYTAEEAVALTETISGEIVGIGITIDFLNGSSAVVASVIPDTPAERAGIQVGDVLIRADGIELAGLKSETILSCIRGEEGTSLHLEVNRGGAIIAFDLVREPVIGTSVESELYEENGEKAMYIRVHGFVKNTAQKFKEALDSAEKQGISNLIIDLRNNGGGIFSQAIEMADCFVPAGKTITTEDHKNEIFNKVYVGSDTEKKEFDTVVLVNQSSASASEVLAAALQENDCALLLGTRSYGKGTIQSINDLQTGGMIKYTVGFYLTPNGSNINGIGLTPDVQVENTLSPVDAEQFGTFPYDRIYQTGDSGADVLRAKEILNFFGIYRGEINEDFDSDLYYAVYAFQQQAGLFPYGVLDLTTQLQLHNYMRTAKMENDDQLAAALAHFGIINYEK